MSKSVILKLHRIAPPVETDRATLWVATYTGPGGFRDVTFLSAFGEAEPVFPEVGTAAYITAAAARSRRAISRKRTAR